MAQGDTRTENLLDIAAHGTRADLPTDNCCNTKTQNYILDVAQRIMNLEDEVHEWEDDPDVVDIVNTYADLQEYDASDLTDKDIIRVLNDETHGGQSTYYRLSKNGSTYTWTYIGSTGPKAEQSDWDEDDTTDMSYILNRPFYSEFASSTFEQGATTTSGSTPDTDYVWFIEQFQDYALHTVLADFNDGDLVYATITYSVDGVEKSDTGKFTLTFENGKANLDYDAEAGSRWYGAYISEVNLGDTTVRWPVLATDSGATVYITGIEYEKVKQIDAKYIPDTGPNINVVQTTGASTVDVMSQKAVTDMVFYNNSATKVSIGSGTQNHATSASVAIGGYSRATGILSVAIGASANDTHYASASGTQAIAIGQKASASAENAVALGWGARANTQGQFDISTGTATSVGYNNSGYRLLTGLYDPQSAHDAATKGYVDTTVPTTLTDVQYEALWSSPNTLNAILTNITTGQGV